jgi:hypothetical protein
MSDSEISVLRLIYHFTYLRILSKFIHPKRMPILIPTFNNPTYLANLLMQLRQFRNVLPVVIDNGSDFPRMVVLLQEIKSRGVYVIKANQNLGPRFVIENSRILRLLPKIFVLTDPDLELKPGFCDKHLKVMKDITFEYKLGKVGLALEIDKPDSMRKEKFLIGNKDFSILDWESQFWLNPIEIQNCEAYIADIDTTFAVYNKKYFRSTSIHSAIRIAGISDQDVTAKHLPWYVKSIVPYSEREYYFQKCEGQRITNFGLGSSCTP